MPTESQISKLIERKLLSKTNSKSFLSPIADALVKMIKVRVRKGFGVKKEGATENKFPGLEDSTIKSRAMQKANGRLMSGVGIKKDALSATGQLVDSIDQKTVKGKSTLFLNDGREDGISNNDLKDWHERGVKYKRGIKKRPFFHVSDKEEKKVKNLMRLKIKEIIRKF